MKHTAYERLTALCLALGLAFASPLTAFGAVEKVAEPPQLGMSQASLRGYSEEAWAKLTDNTLEYDEIYDLLKNFNPDLQRAWGSFAEGISSVDTGIADLEAARRDMEALLETAKAEGAVPLIGLYSGQIVGLDKAKAAMQRSRDNLAEPISKNNAALRMATEQLASAARIMMIQFKNMEEQEKLLAQLLHLQESLLLTRKSLYEQGMATNVELLAAHTECQSAKSNLSNLQLHKEKLRLTLITLLGWEATDSPVIADIPHLDMAYLQQLDLEADTQKATSNNTALVSLRNSRKSVSDYANELTELRETQMENSVKIKMGELYGKIQEEKLSYEAAALSYEAAQQSFAGAQRSKELGMLSESAYIGAGLSYVKSSVSHEAAKLQLLTAVENYKAAILGQLSLE